MLFDRIAEVRIAEAIERDEFDDLPGRGKPLDLSAYFAAPPELRASLAVLKNARVLPQEMGLRRQIAALEEQGAGGNKDGSRGGGRVAPRLVAENPRSRAA
jgi:DnaJ homologue, subfamily C, member 28, conserved domain